MLNSILTSLSPVNVTKPGIMPFAFICVLGFIFGAMGTTAQAQLVVTNWSIVGNTVSFDINGTIDSGATIGSFDKFRLYIGVPGDTDWVDAVSDDSSVTNGGPTGIDSVAYNSDANGDYIQILKAGFTDWNLTDGLSASISISGGTLVGANIDPNSIIVAAGNSNISPFELPHPPHQVGVYSAVPEPSAYAMIFGLVAFAGTVVGVRKRMK